MLGYQIHFNIFLFCIYLLKYFTQSAKVNKAAEWGSLYFREGCVPLVSYETFPSQLQRER